MLPAQKPQVRPLKNSTPIPKQRGIPLNSRRSMPAKSLGKKASPSIIESMRKGAVAGGALKRPVQRPGMVAKKIAPVGKPGMKFKKLY